MGLIKVLIVLALIICAIIFVLENAQEASITFLSMGIHMPLAFLVVILLGAGFLVGWLTGTWRSRQKKK
jgi:uncharacterized membrane protein YciS (DUF1049 family)